MNYLEEANYILQAKVDRTEDIYSMICILLAMLLYFDR